MLKVLFGVSAADETPSAVFSFAQGSHLIIGKLRGLSFLCSERRMLIPVLTVVICVPLHQTFCQCGVIAPQVVKEGFRIQIVMSSRSLPFFQPTWTFVLGRALWYPAFSAPVEISRKRVYGSLRRNHRSQAGQQLGDSAWLPALLCLTRLFCQSPSFCSRVNVGMEITSTPPIAPMQKRLFFCCCLPLAALVVLSPHPEQPASQTAAAAFLEEKHSGVKPGFVSLSLS